MVTRNTLKRALRENTLKLKKSYRWAIAKSALTLLINQLKNTIMKIGQKVRVRITPDIKMFGVVVFIAKTYAVVAYDGGSCKGNICTFDELEEI